ncbi:MAG: PAC2 family protein [Thermoplasmata archaeon]|nr:PAC2 family protein [Thermoplasmata archaeon]MCI4359047.1 PAC2 family protein [Thermoplasmata archaeon]
MTMPADAVRIYEVKRVDVEGAIVIDGFPSVGLVSSIVANYLIDTLEMEQIGIVESPSFPTVSLIRDGNPQHPVRIYAGRPKSDRSGRVADKIVAFVSEFHPPPNIIHPLATAILDWVQEQRCGLIVSPEGLVVEPSTQPKPRSTPRGDAPKLSDVKIYGVASTRRARELYIEPNMRLFTEGVITGIAGVLLNEGRRRGFDVLTFLAEAQADYPDARAAARVIESINSILLRTPLDPVPLYHEAERIEQQLLLIQRRAAEKGAADSGSPAVAPMYR